MTTITPQQAGGLNVTAFMDMISVAEGTSTSPITQNDGYDMLVNSIDARGNLVRTRFSDYSTHPFVGKPSLMINSRGLTSNAAGRYQQMLKDWPHYQALLSLPDFGPLSQDMLCIQHIKECGALVSLANGDLATAIHQCSNIWASLPGNNYGQPQQPIDGLQAAYILNGGAVA